MAATPDTTTATLPALPTGRSAPTRAATTTSWSPPPARSSPSRAATRRWRRSAGAPGWGSARSTATFRRARTWSRPTYYDGVEEVCASAVRHADDAPWEALTGWLREFVAFAATKRVLADEMFAVMDRDAPFFKSCSGVVYDAGEPLLRRAQDAGVVRDDVDINDVTKMVMGIADLRTAPARPDRTPRRRSPSTACARSLRAHLAPVACPACSGRQTASQVAGRGELRTEQPPGRDRRRARPRDARRHRRDRLDLGEPAAALDRQLGLGQRPAAGKQGRPPPGRRVPRRRTDGGDRSAARRRRAGRGRRSWSGRGCARGRPNSPKA